MFRYYPWPNFFGKNQNFENPKKIQNRLKEEPNQKANSELDIKKNRPKDNKRL